MRRNEDTFSVQIVDASGTLHLFDKLQLASVRVENASLMPGDYGTQADGAGDRRRRRLSGTPAGSRNRCHRPDVASWRRRRRTAGQRSAETAELADVLGRLSGDALLGARSRSTRPTSRQLAGGVDVSDAGRLGARGHAARRRRRHVHDAAGRRWSALDARTGRQIWRYTRPQKVKNPYEINPFNRGVADRSAIGCSSARSTPRSSRSTRRTGLPLWEVQVADTMLGYSLTSAPLVVKDKVLVGITGGEFGARGFLDAYDAATGKRLWRWYAVPGPGEFGNDTWKGDSWKRGGSPMWLTGSYDPELNLVYWTVGNPATADRSIGARRPRQPVQRFGRRDRSGHRPAQVALPVHAERRARLGLVPGRHPRRPRVARADAQAAAARRSQRHVLRARSHERGVPVRHAVRLSELEHRLRRERPADRGAGIELEPRGQLLRLSDARRRHELSGAVLQPAHRAGCISSTRESGQRYVSAPATYEAGRQYIGRRATGAGAGRAQARTSRRRRPASRRSIRKPARRCGTSRSFRAR